MFPHKGSPDTAPQPLVGWVARPRGEIAGDMRDRLTILLYASQIVRLASEQETPQIQSALRLIEEQVGYLGRLADELDPDGATGFSEDESLP